MIALIDYGIGNLRSVYKALETVGADVQLTDDAEVILSASRVVLPGVGAFKDGMDGLRVRGLISTLKALVERETPLLGICVGMQLMFEIGEEMGENLGLGYLPGRVRCFPDQGLKIPQTGWNQLIPIRSSCLFEGLPSGSYAYFNHSYYCDASPEDSLAITEYGLEYPSVVGRGRLYGVQFHPEKSQSVGLTILRNFVERG